MGGGDPLSKDLRINAIGCEPFYLDERELWHMLMHPKVITLLLAYGALQASSATAGMYQANDFNTAMAAYFLVVPFFVLFLYTLIVGIYMRCRRSVAGHSGPVVLAPELILVPMIFAIYRLRLHIMETRSNADVEVLVNWWQPTIFSILALTVVSFIIKYIVPTMELEETEDHPSELHKTATHSDGKSTESERNLVQIGNQAIRGEELKMLEAQGNYVKVVTTQGNSLVRGTFSELLKEAESVDGVQIHRSHWVSLDACRGLTRKSKEQFLQLDTGEMLKVARSRVKHVEEQLAKHGINTQLS